MSASIAACHSGSAASFFWKASDVCRRVAQRAQLFALGEDDRIVEFA
jgi:hypothetical protein